MKLLLPIITLLLDIQLGLCLLYFGCAGSCCSAGFPLVAASRGYSPVVVNRLLLAVGFLVVKQGSRPCGLSSCLTRALLLHDMWHLPGPVMCPLQLAGRLLTTGPPGVPKTFSSTSPQNHIPVKCSVSIPPLSSISQPPIYFQSLWIYLF